MAQAKKNLGQAEQDTYRLTADFSRGLYFKHLESFNGPNPLHNVVVLNISRSELTTGDLARCLKAAPHVVRLDASRCSLEELPDAQLWRSQVWLKVLLLHQNSLTSWVDLERACSAPDLKWLTVFQNPIAGDPTIRSQILAQKPDILAVDHVIVTEPERLSWNDSYGGMMGKFQARALDPDYIEEHKPGLSLKQQDSFMVKAALKEIHFIESFSKQRSPSRRIQAIWRGFRARRAIGEEKARIVKAVQRIQRGARQLLWRRKMVEHVKEFLAEIDELDLLLDAKEMLRRRALKLIEASVQRWLLRRSLHRMERKAVEIIGRFMRGCLARRRLFYNVAKFHESSAFYFPEHHAWEFHVVCNMVLRAHGFPVLPPEHTFEDSDIVGIRFPEFDEAPRRQTTLLRFMGLAGRVVVRPLRSGRFPNHRWDGPFHRLVDEASSDVQFSLDKVKRRGDKVNNRSRQAFRLSCCSGEHPIRRKENHSNECLVLKELLEAPEHDWPEEAKKDGFLRTFLKEAQLLKPKTWHRCWVKSHAEVDPASGLRNYAQTAWLSQRILKQRMPTAKVALELCYALHSFSRTVNLPSMESVPALYEKAMIESASAAVVQSSWRAHALRRSLKCSLKKAVLFRRAAMCIQRCWRWNLFKRRIELLAGAVHVARSVRTSTLYIEERLLSGLNTISTVDRYPRLPESQLAMGFAEAPVILRRPEKVFRRRNSGLFQAGQNHFKPLMYGREGFPKWFLKEAPIELAPADVSLRPLRGLQGLLLEGLGGPDAFNFFGEDKSFLEVASPLLENFAHACAAPGGLEKDLHVDLAESTIAASGGCLRFAELRFPSVLQAKQRAVLLYLCTFNFEKHAAVPLLRRHQLYDVQTAYHILQLWELYGLDWPHRSKVGFFLLRQREPKPSEVVYVNGTKHRSAVAFRAEWQSAEEDQKRTGVSKEQIRKENLQRLEELKQKKRRKDLQEIQDILAGVSVPQLLEALETGKLPDDVDLHSVEAWILGNRANFQADRVDKKLLAKRVAADKMAMKLLLLEAKEANRTQKYEGDGSEAERLKQSREWEERLMKFYGSVRAERVSAETECLIRAHQTWHGERWLVDETESIARSSPEEVSETASERAEREERQRQLELSEEMNDHISLQLQDLEDDSEKDFSLGLPMQHAVQSMRSGRSQFSDSWYASVTMSEVEDTQDEADAQREREALHQAKRDKIVQTKETKRHRREMRQMAATFCNRRCAIESRIRAADQQQVKAEHQDRTKEKVEAKKRVWKQRRDVMEMKNQQSLEHRRRQVDDLRSELEWLTQMQNEKLQEELEGKKAAIVEKKVTKRLTRATQRLDSDFVNSFDAFGMLPAPSPMDTGYSAFSEVLTGIAMSKRNSRHSVDFRKTIATCTESTASGFTEQGMTVDPNQSWVSEADPFSRMAATMQTLPEVTSGWAAKLSATDSNWKKAEEKGTKGKNKSTAPWPSPERRFPALRFGGDPSGVNPWRQRLALSAR